MFSIATVIKSDFSAQKIAKQMLFATAVSLTQTAKEAQSEVVSELRQTFTLRGRWFEQGNKFGIKIKSAKKDDLQSVVYTNADWLVAHETGEDKKPRGNSLAIPTTNIRRNKRDIIIKSNRPRNVKNAFILTLKNGHRVIFVRKGRKKNRVLVPLYNLTTKARIQKQSTVIEPIKRIVEKNLNKNFENALKRALATAK